MLTEYAPIREQLQHRLEVLRGRVIAMEHELRHADGPAAQDSVDRASDSEHEEVLAALDDSGRRELQEVEAALARMDAGTYGICERTGQRIPLQRLKLVPTARFVVPGPDDDDD
jgi:RNA polymerase-binding transcription factor DksA